jgi:hypothetical protein
MLRVDQTHPASLDDAALLRDCRVTRSRASGPGGQHRNKVETAVSIAHVPSGCEGWAGERRSQEHNRRVALRRLRIELALAVRVGRRLPDALWQGRVRDRRIVLSARHADFPAMLAEALDFVTLERFDVARAARRLGCSTSQLVGLLKDEPRALEQVNAARRARGLRALR